jgi:hypothetical protein
MVELHISSLKPSCAGDKVVKHRDNFYLFSFQSFCDIFSLWKYREKCLERNANAG